MIAGGQALPVIGRMAMGIALSVFGPEGARDGHASLVFLA